MTKVSFDIWSIYKDRCFRIPQRVDVRLTEITSFQVAAKEDELKTVLELERETVERRRRRQNHDIASTSPDRSPQDQRDDRFVDTARPRQPWRVEEQLADHLVHVAAF